MSSSRAGADQRGSAPRSEEKGMEGCIVGRGASGNHGYKRGWVQVGAGGYRVQAHQFAYLLAFGPYEQGLEIRHRCDNRACVNPDHLEVGTHADNMQDMAERGRASGWRADATHCVRGHEFTEENTYLRLTGGRRCRACARLYQAERRAARA